MSLARLFPFPINGFLTAILPRRTFLMRFQWTIDGSTEAWWIRGARTSTKTSSQLCSMVERVHFVAAGLEHLRSPSETIQNFARKCYRRLSEQQSINWRYNRMVKEGEKTSSWFKFCGMTWWGFFSQNTPEILKWNRCGWGGVLLNSFASLYTSYSYRHPFPPAHTVIAQFISMQTPYSQAVFAIVT